MTYNTPRRDSSEAIWPYLFLTLKIFMSLCIVLALSKELLYCIALYCTILPNGTEVKLRSVICLISHFNNIFVLEFNLIVFINSKANCIKKYIF